MKMNIILQQKKKIRKKILAYKKLIKNKKEKGQDTTYTKEIYKHFYGEYPPDL